MKNSWFITIALILLTIPVKASEIRCGWLDNSMSANWLLIDQDGSWTISTPGGYHAEGIINIPSFDNQEYVKTKVNYGYGCECLNVVTDSSQMRIVSIENGKVLALSICRTDPYLPKKH